MSTLTKKQARLLEVLKNNPDAIVSDSIISISQTYLIDNGNYTKLKYDDRKALSPYLEKLPYDGRLAEKYSYRKVE